ARHKYELGETLAQNDMSRFVAAQDVNVGRTIVMKSLTDTAAAVEENISRLISEAQIIGRLEHPYIVPLYELSIDELGRAYYTTKAVKGVSLAQILTEIKNKKTNAIVHFNL